LEQSIYKEFYVRGNNSHNEGCLVADNIKKQHVDKTRLRIALFEHLVSLKQNIKEESGIKTEG